MFFKYLCLAASSLSWGRRDRVVPETEPWPLHWKVDFSPLGHQESPTFFFFFLNPNKLTPLRLPSFAGGKWRRQLPSDGGFPGGSDGKESVCSAGDWDSLPGSGRSLGEGKGNPLQYSCLESPMDRGAWWALQPMGSQSRTQLSDYHNHNQHAELL